MTPAWLSTTPFAVVDLETTGPEPETARIVQVGVLQVDFGLVTGAWSALVNPGEPIPAEASEVHGITDEHVRGAPDWAATAPAFMRLIRGRGLVGYNAIRYDWPILLRQLAEVGIETQQRGVLDVMVTMKHLDRYVAGKGRHRLSAAAERWGVQAEQAHDALGDCKTTWALLRALLESGKVPATANPQRFVDWIACAAAEQAADFRAWLARQESMTR